jgi:hypothetical protein
VVNREIADNAKINFARGSEMATKILAPIALLIITGCGLDQQSPASGSSNEQPLWIEQYRGNPDITPSTRVFASDQYDGKNQVNSLPNLHLQFVNSFIESPGFGGGRIRPITIHPPTRWYELQPRRVSPGQPAEKRPSPRKDIARGQADYDRTARLLMHGGEDQATVVDEMPWDLTERLLVSTANADNRRVYRTDLMHLHNTIRDTKQFDGKTAPAAG